MLQKRAITHKENVFIIISKGINQSSPIICWQVDSANDIPELGGKSIKFLLERRAMFYTGDYLIIVIVKLVQMIDMLNSRNTRHSLYIKTLTIDEQNLDSCWRICQVCSIQTAWWIGKADTHSSFITPIHQFFKVSKSFN
jgi:hypothetical protein